MFQINNKSIMNEISEIWYCGINNKGRLDHILVNLHSYLKFDLENWSTFTGRV